MPVRRRRTLLRWGFALAGLVLLLGCQLISAPAPAPKIPRIGYVTGGTPETAAPSLAAFRQGLRDQGYVEGESILLELRYAEGRNERFPDLVGDLVGLKVDVLVTGATPATLAAKQATSSIPIVFFSVGDPIAAGLVESLNQPGGNVTGMSSMTPGVNSKRLQLLKDLLPHLTRVAVLRDVSNPIAAGPVGLGDLPQMTASMGLQFQDVQVRRPEDLPGAFQEAAGAGAEALVDTGCPMTCAHPQRVVQLAAQHRLPTMYQFRTFTDAGGLLAYGIDDAAMFRRVAAHVAKVLKGARPADLPVEQPTEFRFIVNLNAASALGLTIPHPVLAQATEVLQ